MPCWWWIIATSWTTSMAASATTPSTPGSVPRCMSFRRAWWPVRRRRRPPMPVARLARRCRPLSVGGTERPRVRGLSFSGAGFPRTTAYNDPGMEAGENRFTDALAQVPLRLRALAEDDARQVGAQLSDLGAMAVPGGGWVAALPRVFVASEFVTRTCVQHPEVLRELIESRDLLRAYAAGELGRRIEREPAGVPDEPALKSRLRMLRRREMLRLAFSDLAGWADLDEVVTAATELADACLAAALEHLNLWATARHGAPVGVGGAPAAMVVLGLGKLGGRELNFSSDIDLVFAYTEEGETARGLSNHEFFVRLGQSLINALNEATAEGFVFRV